MFKYGKRSKQVLSEIDPEMERLFNRVIEGYDCSLICGHRTQEDQTRAFIAGTSQVPWPESKHNTVPSMAVDAVPYPLPKDWGKIQGDGARAALQKYSGELTGKELQKFIHFGNYVLGVAAGMGIKIEWGGQWKTFKDYPHFNRIGV